MPDDDRLPRSLTGRWRRVMKAFQAGEPPEDIAYHVARATADTLRRTHGIPGRAPSTPWTTPTIFTDR